MDMQDRIWKEGCREMEITGAELFVKALKAEGVEMLFWYPGVQAMDLFDALYDEKDIEVILPRHEQAAAHAADGYARTTGRVGVCLATSGPGAANLVTGIATAAFNSVPLVCFTGQVASELLGREAFQELDIASIVAPVAKYAVTEPPDRAAWRREIAGWQQAVPRSMPGEGMTPLTIIDALNRLFPEGIISADVGQNQLWAAQLLHLNQERRLITSGGMGTMGYGLPAAIGAKLVNPDKAVLVIAGDGGMQMNMQELVTAAAYELPLIICVFNNGRLGNVRQWQEMFYNQRYAHTCLGYRRSCDGRCVGKDCNRGRNNVSRKSADSGSNAAACPAYIPDFVSLAESCGARGIRIEKAEEIEPALAEAGRNRHVPCLIEFVIDSHWKVLPIVPPGKPLTEMLFK